MAQLNEQPGATETPQQDEEDQKMAEMQKELDAKNAQLEAMQKDIKMAEMQKELDAKNAQLEAMQKKLAALNAQPNSATDEMNTLEGPGNDQVKADEKADDDDSKAPPKSDVTLSLRGVPEYDQYPYAMKGDKFYFMASIKAPYFRYALSLSPITSIHSFIHSLDIVRSDKRAPIDLVAVVDESGSMHGDRMKLVKV